MLPPPPNTREKITLPESGIVFEYLFTWLCVGMKLSIETRKNQRALQTSNFFAEDIRALQLTSILGLIT